MVTLIQQMLQAWIITLGLSCRLSWEVLQKKKCLFGTSLLILTRKSRHEVAQKLKISEWFVRKGRWESTYKLLLHGMWHSHTLFPPKASSLYSFTMLNFYRKSALLQSFGLKVTLLGAILNATWWKSFCYISDSTSGGFT